MLLDGSWKKNNVTNYVTCDDYEPKYSPKRFNLNLRSYLQKVSVIYWVIMINFRKKLREPTKKTLRLRELLNFILLHQFNFYRSLSGGGGVCQSSLLTAFLLEVYFLMIFFLLPRPTLILITIY